MDEQKILSLFSLEGKIAIVTGGLGRLGSEYVKIFTAAGAKVAIVDIGKSDAPNVYHADITNKRAVVEAFKEIIKDLGVPTILVNNAGIDAPPNAGVQENGPFEDFSEESWNAVIDSHLKGMLLMCQEFLRHLKIDKKEGSIINISSTYGVVAPDQSIYDFRRKRGEEFYKPVAYSVAKSGVLNFTRWLAEYCHQRGLPVRVNTLVPGGVLAGQDKEFLTEYNKRTMLGRMAKPDEFNAAVLFLASNSASAYMTGSTLIVDGGWTAK